MKNQLITLREVAEELGVTPPTLRKLIRSGQLRTLNINGKPRIRRFTLDKFLVNAERKGAS